MQLHEDSKANIKYFEYQKFNFSLTSTLLLDPLVDRLMSRIPEGTNTNLLSLAGAFFLTFAYIITLLFGTSSTT